MALSCNTTTKGKPRDGVGLISLLKKSPFCAANVKVPPEEEVCDTVADNHHHPARGRSYDAICLWADHVDMMSHRSCKCVPVGDNGSRKGSLRYSVDHIGRPHRHHNYGDV